MGEQSVIAFAVIAALLTITPGADTVLVMRNVMRQGQRAGFLTAFGVCAGLFLHATFSAIGLSVLLVKSATVFNVVKFVGAAYLVWLGVLSVRHALRRDEPARDDTSMVTSGLPGHRDSLRPLLEGFFSNILNPKVAVFYLALLPQFIGHGDWPFGRSMLLAWIHWVEGIVWLSLVTIFVGRMRTWLARRRVRRRIECVTGVVMIALGARLALDRR